MHEVDTIVVEEFDHGICHESCPLVHYYAFWNTKAGNDVTEDKVADRVCRGDFERLCFDLLGKEIGGHDNELIMLRGMRVDNANIVDCPSSSWSGFNNWL